MDLIASLFAQALAAALWPLNKVSPAATLTMVAALLGFLLAKAFGMVSSQGKIRVVKSRLEAQMLAVVLYRDNIVELLKAPWRLLTANLAYLKYTLPPVLLLTIVGLPVLAQLNNLYGHRSLDVGDAVTVAVFFEEREALQSAALMPGNGFKVATPALRVQERLEANWKLVALQPGRHNIEVSAMGDIARKAIVVGQTGAVLSAKRSKSALSAILYPGERRILKTAPFERIEVRYPQSYINLAGWQTHWLVLFFMASLAGAYLGMRIFKIAV